MVQVLVYLIINDTIIFLIITFTNYFKMSIYLPHFNAIQQLTTHSNLWNFHSFTFFFFLTLISLNEIVCNLQNFNYSTLLSTHKTINLNQNVHPLFFHQKFITIWFIDSQACRTAQISNIFLKSEKIQIPIFGCMMHIYIYCICQQNTLYMRQVHLKPIMFRLNVHKVYICA